mmetsp:Transcript_33842/g.107436  ORF Transcript_33842/g.107436 Transcript_33842/m.107436 type:complete len:381 (+) Transcript_33842:123-1265(+)|eukprot:CAMPEP_0182864274 /NCGR_PEP_ID=MMETSP0034_2-20130328/7083_1 /TAXON_ID=156128 /ORGANISM="Nephroselmis pyriformis, Strain CCMP717" /LENGTH=380 /DNA_ID=CAMNT_0024996527 /DNA_START=122 /DNA_END=1264 /DNA_ORIENTATION=+
MSGTVGSPSGHRNSTTVIGGAAPAADPNRKVALITGVTGQDGSYLVELLLAKGYEVHGIKRRASSYNHARLEHIVNASGYPNAENFHLHYGDLTDLQALCTLIRDIRPSELYNLAAQSHVQVSFQMPMYTAEVDGVGTLNLLEALRMCGQEHSCRFYQASTSELYGKVHAVPQSEETPFHPRSPYAVAKLMAFWAVVNYREAYNMYATNGILFNHESPRRGETFVTRKVTMAVANILREKQDCLYLGNLDAKRDWGHARDYVECMWKILQEDEPEDFVVATGVTTTVRRFCELAFGHVGMTLRWEGEGVEECGICTQSGKVVVRVSEKYFRPAEVDLLLGDPTKARTKLKWDPQMTSLEDLVKEMVDADIARVDDPSLRI